MSNKNKSYDESKEDMLQHSIHTYTPQSHENLLRQFSKSAITFKDTKDFKRENDYLKKELNNSKKELKRLKRRLLDLEGSAIQKVEDRSSFLYNIPEDRSDNRLDIETNNDNEFVKSWEVLGTHFSEVIRRHHEVLEEKDRQIRELQEKQYNREISHKVTNCSIDSQNCNFINNDSIDLAQQKQNLGLPLENHDTFKTRTQSSRSVRFADQCDVTEESNYKDDCSMNSGEILREHFSEVIRRHKQELMEKDRQIQELQQALEECVNRKPPLKQVDDSEVQMWYHDYDYHSHPSVRTGQQAAKPLSSPKQIQESPRDIEESPKQNDDSSWYTKKSSRHNEEYSKHNKESPRYNEGNPRHNEDYPRYIDESSKNKESPRYNKESPRHNEEYPKHNKESPRYNEGNPRHNEDNPRYIEESSRNKESPRHNEESPRHNEDSPRYIVESSRHNEEVLSNIKESPEHIEESPRHVEDANDSIELLRHPVLLSSHASQSPTTSASYEDNDSFTDSTDTFVAIEKCQRLESIANLERLRRNILQRLELEEKLDTIYWQTELGRYQTLRDEAGDTFDPNGSLNEDFEMLESTRLELLRALKEVKDAAEREPEIFVKPHFPFQDSESLLKAQVQVPEIESKRQVKFREEITITAVQTLYEE